MKRVLLVLSVFIFLLPACARADVDALLAGARAEVARQPLYISSYHRGGYPPESMGVCTDLVWRAFRDAGIDLKKLIDADIKAAPSAYPRVGGKPDPNIDFRRVPNQSASFRRHAEVLSTSFKPGDQKVMAAWKPGDIVVFRGPDHIAIISDKKNSEDVPLLLHNDGPWATEADAFERWASGGIVAHYRWKWQ